MNVLTSLKPEAAGEDIEFLALGFFDGLHRGHREVILGCAPQIPLKKRAALTFDRHPAAVLRPQAKPPLITGLEHKLELLKEWGVGAVVVLTFDHARAWEAAEDFLEELGRAFPRLRAVGVGQDWRFGHDRKGDTALLKKWGEKRSVEVHVAQFVEEGAGAIGSRRIREAIQRGNFKQAQAMLGRAFSLYGEVVRGQGRGAVLQFPTINLRTQDECLPPLGVYAGETILQDGTRWLSALNLGYRPTVDEGKQAVQLEAHLIGFSGTLYGAWVELVPQRYLRAQQKFNSMQQLAEAIEGDIKSVNAFCSKST